MPNPNDYQVKAELTSAAFEQSPDAMFVVSRSGVVLLANVQAELLTGRPRADLVGQSIESLIPQDRREAHVEHRTTYMRNPFRRLMGRDLDLAIMQRVDTEDERPVPVDVNLAPVVTSLGPVVVATVRLRGDHRWGDSHP